MVVAESTFWILNVPFEFEWRLWVGFRLSTLSDSVRQVVVVYVGRANFRSRLIAAVYMQHSV